MLIHIKEIVKKAIAGEFALGAFNTSNLEMTLGIFRGALAKKSPMIVQVSESTINYAGLKTIVSLIESVANNEGREIPVALHLDHGKSFRSVVECIRAGFSSIHIDASDLPFEENITITKQSVDYAHRFGAWAQGELGTIFGKEGMTEVELPKDPNKFMTDPSRVKEFVARTGIDTLAVSVGTMHGAFEGKEIIDLKRLVKINKEVELPLVLHGASGTNPDDIRQAIKNGVRIINIDTTLRLAFTQTLKKTIAAKEFEKFYDPRRILAPSIEAVRDDVIAKIEIFGSGN
ncbi:MAG: class II fructose-bisphosphate aldolase [Patescibacteria group bacterium]